MCAKRNLRASDDAVQTSKKPAARAFGSMGDTGLETVDRGHMRHEGPCLLSFDALKLAGIRSEWNLEWNLGAPPSPAGDPAPDSPSRASVRSEARHTIRCMLTVAQVAGCVGKDPETVRRWDSLWTAPRPESRQAPRDQRPGSADGRGRAVPRWPSYPTSGSSAATAHRRRTGSRRCIAPDATTDRARHQRLGSYRRATRPPALQGSVDTRWSRAV